MQMSLPFFFLLSVTCNENMKAGTALVIFNFDMTLGMKAMHQGRQKEPESLTIQSAI